MAFIMSAVVNNDIPINSTTSATATSAVDTGGVISRNACGVQACGCAECEGNFPIGNLFGLAGGDPGISLCRVWICFAKK